MRERKEERTKELKRERGRAEGTKRGKQRRTNIEGVKGEGRAGDEKTRLMKNGWRNKEGKAEKNTGKRI